MLWSGCLVMVLGVAETQWARLEQCQDGFDFTRGGLLCQLVCYADSWVHPEQCWDCSDCQDRLDLPASLLLNLCIP